MPMEVLLMRHGIARELGEDGVTRDAERTLTAEGRRKVKAIGDALRRLDYAPAAVLSSPAVRARQTADIAAEALNGDLRVEECDFLAPGAQADDLLKWLKGSAQPSVLVVGHMPDLAEIVSVLVCGHANADISFKKAAVCCLSFDHGPAAGKARLEALLQPRLLLAITDP